MNRIVVTPQAEADQAEIWLRIARQNPQAADRLVAQVASNIETLAGFPSLGQACTELGPGIRASVVGRYVTYYRPIEGGIEVLRVVHGARDVENLFDPG